MGDLQNSMRQVLMSRPTWADHSKPRFMWEGDIQDYVLDTYGPIYSSVYDKRRRDYKMSSGKQISFEFDDSSGFWYELPEGLGQSDTPSTGSVKDPATSKPYCQHEWAVYDSGFRRIEYCKHCNMDKPADD